VPLGFVKVFLLAVWAAFVPSVRKWLLFMVGQQLVVQLFQVQWSLIVTQPLWVDESFYLFPALEQLPS